MPSNRPFFLSLCLFPGVVNFPNLMAKGSTCLIGQSTALAEMVRKMGQPLPAYAHFLSSLWRVNVVTDGITVQKIYLSVANASHRTDAVPTKNALASSFISRRLVPLVRSRLGF